MLRKAIFIELLLLITCLSLAGQCPAQVLEHVSIYKKAGVYACFPNMFKSEDGTLVLSFGTRTTSSHYDSTGGGKTLISRDEGKTWTEPNKPYFNPSYKDAEGRLVIPYVHGWRKISDEGAVALKSQGIFVARANQKNFYATGAAVKTSKDGGRTWESRELSLPFHVYLMSSGYLRTKAGVRIMAVYGKHKEERPQEVYFIRSGDDGKTWQFFHMPPPGKESRASVGLNETALVETENGEILAMMRSAPDSIGYLYQSLSRDEGLTWSKPQRTTVWGYPANLISVQDKVICTYGYRKAPMGARVSVFTNNFLTPAGEEIILRDDAEGWSGDLGYPVTVSLGKETFFTVYYITTRDGITHIAGTRWKLADHVTLESFHYLYAGQAESALHSGSKAWLTIF